MNAVLSSSIISSISWSQAAEVRRRNLEIEQLALLEAKKKRGEEVRARKTSDEELSENNLEKIE